MGMVAIATLPLVGCVTQETVSFRASNANQQAIIRDGRNALVSRQKNSLVLVSPASRQIATGGRPVFVVGINNLSPQPVNFLVSQVEANQMVGEQAFSMQVITYEALLQEERNRQVGRAILGGSSRGCECLRRVAGWLRHVQCNDSHAAWRHVYDDRHVLQPHRERDCAEPGGCAKRSDDFSDYRARTSKHGDA